MFFTKIVNLTSFRYQSGLMYPKVHQKHINELRLTFFTVEAIKLRLAF